MASDSRSPAVPAGGPPPASPGARRGAPRRASGPGSGAESPSSWDTGCGRKGGRPLARHAPHVRGEPGAKPFVDDLLLGRGFVRSRAAPSLRSIESQPSTQGFVAHAAAAVAAAGPGGRLRRPFLPPFPPSLSRLPPPHPAPRGRAGLGAHVPRTGPRRSVGGGGARPAGGRRGREGRGRPSRRHPGWPRRAAPPPHPAVGLAHGLGRGKGRGRGCGPRGGGDVAGPAP